MIDTHFLEPTHSICIDKSSILNTQILTTQHISVSKTSLSLQNHKFSQFNLTPSSFNWKKNILKNKNIQNIDFNDNVFYHGIDWLYSFLDTLFMYDYSYVYISFFLTYFDEFYNYMKKIFWFFIMEINTYQLLYSYYLDKYFLIIMYNFPFIQSWYKNILISKEVTFICLFHPEILFINELFVTSFIFKYTSYTTFQLLNLINHEIISTATLLFFHLICLLFFLNLGILLYFSFFTSSTKEEGLVDNDYMLTTITIEAEEEIASIDDIIMLLCLIFYLYGWFFYAHFWFILTKLPDLVFLMYLFPYLYYIIIFIPSLLLYDFGIFFVAYLRGVASLPLFFLELIFDFVALMAFYIRILVQGVRLLLMAFTYASLHDFILYYSFDQRLWQGNETLFDEWNNMWSSTGTFSFFFFFTILARLYYWLYELLHTFFVLTAQFIAFFAMVFWLFFFLYTFFSFEKHESYFLEKRNVFFNYINKKKIW